MKKQKKKKKIEEKFFVFQIIGSGKFSQSWTGYLSSAVTVWTNTPKISPISRGEILLINFPENDEKTW